MARALFGSRIMSKERIQQLEKEIEELKAQWPAHSVPNWMLERLEDLEDELDREKAREEDS
ncbi:MAG: histidine kinase [Dehalococcoidia bacterium]